MDAMDKDTMILITLVCEKVPWSKFDEMGTLLVLGEGKVREVDFVKYEGRLKGIKDWLRMYQGIDLDGQVN